MVSLHLSTYPQFMKWQISLLLLWMIPNSFFKGKPLSLMSMAWRYRLGRIPELIHLLFGASLPYDFQ
jgi:hypothetical protein